MKQYRPHLFVLCVLALILTTGAHAFLQNALTAMRFGWLPRQANGGIVVVAIDPPSIEEIGVWPWPRTIHADLIGKLENAGASEIVFDIDFSSPSIPAADRAFEDALKSAGGSVVLPAFKQSVGDRGKGNTIYVTRPLPEFARHTWPAAVNVELDPDGLVRRYRFGEVLDGEFLPSVGALFAGRYESNGDSLLIDFGIRSASVPTVSYVDVLHGDPAVMERLKGKKVIIGATALELGDRFNVPNGQVIAGALLQALAAESIIQGRALHVSSTIVTGLELAILVAMMLALWRRLAAGTRLSILLGSAAAVELGAGVLQAALPVVADTSLFHAAVAGYLVALALDEIDFRRLLGTIAERRFQRIAMSLGDGLVCVDEGGLITFWNPGAATIFGYSSEEMVGQPFSRVLTSANANEHALRVLTELPNDVLRAPGGKVMELEGCRKQGEPFPVEACFSAWQGTSGLQYGAVLRDISVRKREAERMRYLARYDTLTGLPNRNTLYEHLESKLGGFGEPREVALLMLDLDRFKDINDTLGHACGDQVLRAVAARLAQIADKTVLIARLGGDEFALVIDGAGAAERAEVLSERVRDSFHREAFSVDGRQLRIDCNVGVALFPQNCADAQELLANADLAMFRAKATGHGKEVFFNSAIRGELEARLSLTAELERATRNGEFELFFQPQVELKSGKLTGAEALIRWRHPERGILSPGSFLPVLNKMPIADTVALWVMETACRQGRLWQESGHDLRIGVNLSPSQFQTGELPACVAAVLKRTGLSPSLLELEVTEDILLEDDEQALEIFRQIRALGVLIALDDFGTGYSSFNYLKKFPLTRLKIDRFFVRELRPDSNDAAIVGSTISLCKLLGLSVIAEGIENRPTIDLLLKMGCEEGQGYCFSPPVPAAKFEQMFLSADGNAILRAANAA